LDVNTSSVLNYKELKEDVKRTLVDQIGKAIKKSSPQNEEARLITNEESIERGFLHFLETGSNPWWMTSGESYHVDEATFETLLESRSFVQQFKRKLTNRSTQERSILQLSNHQLAQIVTKITPEVSFLTQEVVLKNIQSLKSSDRLKLWNVLIDHSVQNDMEGMINRLIFLVTQKLSKDATDTKAEQRIDLSTIHVIHSIFQSIGGFEKVKETIHLLQKNIDLSQEHTKAQLKKGIQKVKPEVSQNPSDTITTQPSHSIDSSVEISTNEKKEEIQKDQIQKEQQKEITKNESATNDSEYGIDQSKKENSTQISQNHTNQSNQASEELQNPADKTPSQDLPVKDFQEEKTYETEENEAIIESKMRKELRESLEELIEPQDRKLFEELESNQQLKLKQDNSGEYQVNNAGLIILHPYLKDFFQYCDLLDEDQQLIDKEMAVHLLHYLATKQEQQYESNMLFEKVLCGVPIKEPVERTIRLSEKHKEMAEDLLEAVLTNWGVLKNASPDLLRNEFLQRLGKINFKENNPKLTVERKVHDILLDKLPWNIGICRLPWLDHLLFTDW
jgi:hypothetical protein